MTTAIGRFTSALLSGSQENTLALASLNFDFSLYKIEAPMEYQGLGSSLSHDRRQSAESGLHHVTARKLGALFRSDMPPVSNLIKAYGKRVSAIAQTPIDLRLLRKEGIFANQVGIDGTSIWAAATSGFEAQGMQLLACMLARFWSAQEATSIWVELIDTRRQMLQKRQGDFDFPEIAAMQATLTREQLAEWDASTRAWLRTADIAKSKQQTQLRLILQNVKVNVSEKPSTYESVMDAWITAMTTIDKLVAGVPQSVHLGSVLLGLSAWHLYPDLLVFEKEFKEIQLCDPLIGQGGMLTVGLEMAPNWEGGVRWSLPLAKLRYYGEPVIASKSMSYQNDRVSFEQLMYIVLGCLFQSWDIPDDEYETVCAHISLLWRWILRQIGHLNKFQAVNKSWLRYVANTCDSFLSSTDAQRQSLLRLIGFGVRRCDTFLGNTKDYYHWLYSLRRPRVYVAVLHQTEDRVKHLRQVAAEMAPSCPQSDWIIAYRDTSESNYVYATVFERKQAAGEQSDDSPVQSSHCRWEALEQRKEASHTSHQIHIVKNSSGVSEDVVKLVNWSVTFTTPGTLLETYNARPDKPNLIFNPLHKTNGNTSLDDRFNSQYCLKPPPSSSSVSFKFFYGDPETAALYRTRDTSGLKSTEAPENVPFEAIHMALEQDRLNPSDFLSQEFFTPSSDSWIFMQAIGAVAEIYKTLPCATISLNITSSPLISSPWISSYEGSEQKASISSSRVIGQWYESLPLTRSKAFSCIIQLETGDKVSPEELENVMAIAIEDSLYLAARLICDPSENPNKHDIRHVLGNIGKAGLSLLVPPAHPMVRIPKVDEWNLINHDMYNGKAEDSFQETSLHLSLTEYRVPYATAHEGARDIQIFFQEAIISIHDRGIWVADVNVLENLEKTGRILKLQEKCPHVDDAFQSSLPRQMPEAKPSIKISSADTWYEFLDLPQNAIVVRSYGNWVGRLAATVLSAQLQRPTFLLPAQSCGKCFGSYEYFQKFAVGKDHVFIY